MEDNKTRVRISVGDSCIEIEGTEDYIETQTESFSPLMERLGGVTASSSAATEGAKPEAKPSAVKKKPVSRVPESYKVLPDLDLAGKGDLPSLEDFYKAKEPRNAMESNTVFVYYLRNLRHGISYAGK